MRQGVGNWSPTRRWLLVALAGCLIGCGAGDVNPGVLSPGDVSSLKQPTRVPVRPGREISEYCLASDKQIRIGMSWLAVYDILGDPVISDQDYASDLTVIPPPGELRGESRQEAFSVPEGRLVVWYKRSFLNKLKPYRNTELDKSGWIVNKLQIQ